MDFIAFLANGFIEYHRVPKGEEIELALEELKDE